MIGTRLNHYEILRPLGKGGMGEVYVAQDHKLGREVALKVLPPALAENVEVRNRFAREAKAIAALNHPGIVTLFSIEEDNGTHFTTMELVHGTTLAELIPAQGFSIDRLFEIAVPLTEAVSAAHEKGITHRDLKPQNIMISVDGRVKVLDFGLAKLREQIPGKAMTQLQGTIATQEGRILGTVAYMSPEQAEGSPVDPRSDIFALGVLLYEMVTGEKPFKGDTGMSIISSILKDTPAPLTAVNGRLPRHLGRIVKRCLEKEPARRYQSTLDLRNDLEGLKEELDSGEFETQPVPLDDVPRTSLVPWLAGAGLVLVAGVVAFLWLQGAERSRGGNVLPQTYYSKLTSRPGQKLYPALAPDGKTVAYAWQQDGDWDIFLHRVGGENPINLTADSDETDTQPAFSPDGEHIAFRSGRDGGGIFVMGATGERVRRLTEGGHNPAWSPDGGTIFYATDQATNPTNREMVPSQLWRVDVETGRKQKIEAGPDGVQPRVSPNGQRIAYWGLHAGGRRDIWTIPVAGGQPVPVTDGPALDCNPVWAPDGRHLYFLSDRGGSMDLWRVAIDERSGRALGEAVAITSGGAATRLHASLSADGKRIALAEQIREGHVHRVRFDPKRGEIERPSQALTSGSVVTGGPDISADGEWLVFQSSGRSHDIFVSRADGTRVRQLTNDEHKNWNPRWSPDGRRIAFESDRSGKYQIWLIEADGRGLRQLTDAPKWASNHTWSPDGTRIAYWGLDGFYVRDLGKPLTEPDEALPPRAEGKFAIWHWSADGRRLSGMGAGIAVYSFESGTYEQLTDFGKYPVWLSDNRRLVFEGTPHSLHLIDSKTKEHREIASFGEKAVSCVSFPKDERWMYFALHGAKSDIWLVTLD